MMLGSGDDVFLIVRGQVHKVGAESPYPYNQVPVVFRLRLGFSKYLRVDDVELHVRASAPEIGFNERPEAGYSFIAFQSRWMKPNAQSRALRKLQPAHFHNRFHDRGDSP